jgi:D(-)-tartrate dehydratase
LGGSICRPKGRFVRIVEVRERSIPLSRYADPRIPSGGLTTSLVAVVTDVFRGGRPIVGYGYASVGRYAQGGLIRERFAPRLLATPAADIVTQDGMGIDPFRAWDVMMAGEKPGGHGERCVAVGTVDMALWDAAAKIADVPLYRLLADRLNREVLPGPVPVYASGGYRYPGDDLVRLAAEIRTFSDLGFTQAKIKIGSTGIDDDLRRIEVASACLGGSENLAVDAMNAYDADTSVIAAAALERFHLRWFEDICDPLDLLTHARVAERYSPPIAAGEAMFSVAEAALLDAHAGLRRDHDVLVFDPVHCYGLPGYLRIVDYLGAAGWPRTAFWPHGGQLFGLHLAAALGLGGAEATPLAFHPFDGPPRLLPVTSGRVPLPEAPGIGFEIHDAARSAFASLT